MACEVFLGGACNPTTWRRELAIPELTRAGVSFFNPQVEEWRPELVAVEAEAKRAAGVLLFVIDAQTRGLASMVEAAEYIAAARPVVLAVLPVPAGAAIGGEAVQAGELKDLNRAREYLRDVAERHGVRVFGDVQSAVREIVETKQRLGGFETLRGGPGHGHGPHAAPAASGAGGCEVFLGGACNPTTWRRELAIPELTRAGVSFFNPQVEEWRPELVAVEAEAKRAAGVLLFVIDAQTRGLASMVEAAEYIAAARPVLLAVLPVPAGAAIGGEVVQAGELKDLNRAREYLRDVAQRHGVRVFGDVQSAVREIVETKQRLGGFETLRGGPGHGHGPHAAPAASGAGGCEVFLGGACNPTTWRRELAIPELTRAGVSFFNPQVEEWRPELVAVEAEAKRAAGVLLFVIDAQTRGLASMVEAAEYIAAARPVVLAVLPVPAGAAIGGEAVQAGELKDLNRAREYLRDVAQRHGVRVFGDVQSAVREIVETKQRRGGFAAAGTATPAVHAGAAASTPAPARGDVAAAASAPPPSRSAAGGEPRPSAQPRREAFTKEYEAVPAKAAPTPEEVAGRLAEPTLRGGSRRVGLPVRRLLGKPTLLGLLGSFLDASYGPVPRATLCKLRKYACDGALAPGRVEGVCRQLCRRFARERESPDPEVAQRAPQVFGLRAPPVLAAWLRAVYRYYDALDPAPVTIRPLASRWPPPEVGVEELRRALATVASAGGPGPGPGAELDAIESVRLAPARRARSGLW
eukprot:tig00021318_g20182.t1